jgi:hypothetical protein
MAGVRTKKIFSRTPPVPLTVHQLRRLQPHQKLVFYKGELDRDIDSNGELPAYVQTLRAIKHAAEALEAQGRITITKMELPRRPGCLQIFAYQATGRKPEQEESDT